MRYGRLGGVADELAQRLERTCRERDIRCGIRTSNLGYFLRCAEPTGFDRSYAAKLGLGAVRFVLDPDRAGQMVTVEDDHFVGVPMEAVAGKVKPVDLTGIRYQALKTMFAYESARAELLQQQETYREAARVLGWLCRHADLATVSRVAMRLNIPTDTLLEVLQDLAQVETGEAAADGRAEEARVRAAG